MVQGFDSAAALLDQGRLLSAVAEERFTGEKATGAFPTQSIEYCLEHGGFQPASIDLVAHGFSYEPHRSYFEHDVLSQDRFDTVYSRSVLVDKFEQTFGGQWSDRIVQVPHHLAHAASAFYPSGFEDALVVVADGMGETESLTVAVASPAGIDPIMTIPEANSLGILYGVFTYYLGFAFGLDEYKVMGLAPYGNRGRYFSAIMDLIHLRPDGTFTIPILYSNPTELDRETYAGTLTALAELFGPAREPDGEITTHHRDLAAGLQAALEATLFHVLRYFKKQTGQQNLCMAGGVALNCSANGVILRSRLFRRMYVQPAAGDDGTSLGAALYVHKNREATVELRGIDVPMCGPSYSDDELAHALDVRSDCIWERFDDFDDLAAVLAKNLTEGKVVGLFQGALEFGPRALGNRSILGDPRSPIMRDLINAKVKKREAFRPFAPAVLEEWATTYFDMRPDDVATYAWMLFTTQVKAEFRTELPAITHIDGTARVQTVARATNDKFWRVIEAFRSVAGIPMVLNTSFNVKGQPIVRTPTEAIDTFLSANLDVLALGNYLVEPARSPR
ncbi:carbamoyltransferase family protein [Mycobacterium attenuatum]|uniref:carbamoyltransferase family protein n=1 Tax=Mycobacterium attenuatum TaxID=2341086 RepID=UPI001B7D6083|nr:carbamoyltransferase C-terminal domain-containing protein [Mycobacterium attenuatum]